MSIESVLYYGQRRTWLMQKTNFDEMDNVHGQKKRLILYAIYQFQRKLHNKAIEIDSI